MKTLLDLYKTHTGKVSDKWALYLREYDRLFAPYREQAISMLEIGIQNGGSLEIWSQYFPNAQKFVGCDINPDCAKLTYADSRISVIVGDATTAETQAQVLAQSASFDLIIEDGSHTSSDIVKAFARYFPALKTGGLFVAEDLHCSYWQDYEGGIFHPYSSITFFKHLADMVNHEHWGIEKSRTELIAGFKQVLSVDFDEILLGQISSVEFVNSICVVRKSDLAMNCLGGRVIAGKTESVVGGHLSIGGTELKAPAQTANIWSGLVRPPAESYEDQLHDIGMGKALHAQQLADIEQLRNDVQVKQADVEQLRSDIQAKQVEVEQLRRDVQDKHAEVASLNNQVTAMQGSRSWRYTAIMRKVGSLVRPIVKLIRQGRELANKNNGYLNLIRKAIVTTKLGIEREGGVRNFIGKMLIVYKKNGLSGVEGKIKKLVENGIPKMPNEINKIYLDKISSNSVKNLKPRVLIVAELSIPQCKKYRVTQKQKMFEFLGVECKVIDWNNSECAIKELQTHSIVIFYRVPAFLGVMNIIEESRRLNIPTYWEVDDLIFNREVLENSKTLAALDKVQYEGLLAGAELYLKAMLSCQYGIASTTGLAQAMLNEGMQRVHVVENALDAQTLMVSAEIKDILRVDSKNTAVRIVYGSGTNTHNVDFEEAMPALLEILKKYNNVHFRLIGLLDLPDEFNSYGDRVERIPVCSYEEYLKLVAECDINIAPLEDFIFNDSKSNIKFLEAAVVLVPSVCSPRSAFLSAISHGVNGYLCETKNEWIEIFSLLINNSELRRKIAKNAFDSVMLNYSLENIAVQQVKKLLNNFENKQLQKDKESKIKILAVNCYYEPRSFGGATLVAAELNKHLNQRDDFDVHMFTTVPLNITDAYTVRRYEADGINVYGMGLPDGLDERSKFENPNVIQTLRNVIAVVDPDIVHLHSIQGIGLSIVDVCIEKKIKYVITLHDAWWLCGRQFMIDQSGKFCEQYVIDKDVCAKCLGSVDLINERGHKMDAALRGASKLLAPSQYFRDFFVANGYPVESIVVNKNGIRRPKSIPKIRSDGPVRFGYVGGNTEIKGVHLVKKVFSELNYLNVELVVVDNATNLGFSSYDKNEFEGIHSVKIVPAYNQNTIDEFFSTIDVLLFPTQCMESFGLVVREALARNVWVISTDAGGVVEDISPGKNGIIIPLSDDGGEFKKAVLESILLLKKKDNGSEFNNLINYYENQSIQLAEILMDINECR